MTAAVLETPVPDNLNALGSDGQPSLLQLRCMGVMASIGPLVQSLESHSANHPNIGDFEAQTEDGSVALHGLLVGERECQLLGGNSADGSVPRVIGRRVFGHLITPDTIYRHELVDLDGPTALRRGHRLRDLLPHRDADALPPMARAALEGVLDEASQVAMQLSVRYQICDDLPIFHAWFL